MVFTQLGARRAAPHGQSNESSLKKDRQTRKEDLHHLVMLHYNITRNGACIS